MLGTVLHLSDEAGELLQGYCHDVSNINVVVRDTRIIGQ